MDWNKPGRLEDFYPLFQDWSFDWLDVAALIRDADVILSYPMVDRDPLDRWTFGRITLLGDAAHPMYPQGGNGGAQTIIDAATLGRLLKQRARSAAALSAYEAMRLPATNRIVLQNRSAPPNVHRRPGRAAHRRQALRQARRRHQPGRASSDLRALSEGRRLSRQPGQPACRCIKLPEIWPQPATQVRDVFAISEGVNE